MISMLTIKIIFFSLRSYIKFSVDLVKESKRTPVTASYYGTKFITFGNIIQIGLQS